MNHKPYECENVHASNWASKETDPFYITSLPTQFLCWNGNGRFKTNHIPWCCNGWTTVTDSNYHTVTRQSLITPGIKQPSQVRVGKFMCVSAFLYEIDRPVGLKLYMLTIMFSIGLDFPSLNTKLPIEIEDIYRHIACRQRQFTLVYIDNLIALNLKSFSGHVSCITTTQKRCLQGNHCDDWWDLLYQRKWRNQ